MASRSYEGTVLGDTYELEGQIGQGQMGVVYRASHTRLPRTFAIKILNANLAADAEHRKRFENEAEIACRVGGDHVVEVFDINSTPEGMIYIVMELLQGQDLDAHIKAAGTLRLSEMVSILNQVTEALEATHERGVIHRDLKPSNLFLCKSEDRQDVVKVLDFGVAKLKNSGFQTETGIMIGSPSYMAPEQARPGSASITPQTDIWALGVILYQCLAGVRPFAEATLEDTLSALCFEEPTPLRDLVPSLSPRVEAVILKALSKEQGARHADAGALRADFAAACEDAWENRIGKGQAEARPPDEKFPFENATTENHSPDLLVEREPPREKSPDGTKVMRKPPAKAPAPEAEKEDTVKREVEDSGATLGSDEDGPTIRREDPAEILQYSPTVAPGSQGGTRSLRSRRSHYMIGVGLMLCAAIVFTLVVGAEPGAKPIANPDSQRTVNQEPGVIATPASTRAKELNGESPLVRDAGSKESENPMSVPSSARDAALAKDAEPKSNVRPPAKKIKKRLPGKPEPDTKKEWDPNSLTLPEG